MERLKGIKVMEILRQIQEELYNSDLKHKTLDRSDFIGFVWQNDSWLLIRKQKENKFQKLEHCYCAARYAVYNLERLFEKNKKVFANLRFTGKEWLYIDGLEMKTAKSKALKIIPQLAKFEETGKITKRYIQDNLMELCFLLENYDTQELELLIQTHKLCEELKNF
jgi:hypothetical protein